MHLKNCISNTSRKRSPNDKSQLDVLFANTIRLCETSLTYLSNLRFYDIVGAIETHTLKEKATDIAARLTSLRWCTLTAPATPSTKSDTGTQGGVLMFHRNSLQAASPVDAMDSGGLWLPEDNIVWKTFRLHGFSISIAFVYFQHNTGLGKENTQMIHMIEYICDAGNNNVCICGDFNATPAEWAESGLLDILQLQVITAGEQKYMPYSYI